MVPQTDAVHTTVKAFRNERQICSCISHAACLTVYACLKNPLPENSMIVLDLRFSAESTLLSLPARPCSRTPGSFSPEGQILEIDWFAFVGILAIGCGKLALLITSSKPLPLKQHSEFIQVCIARSLIVCALFVVES